MSYDKRDRSHFRGIIISCHLLQAVSAKFFNEGLGQYYSHHGLAHHTGGRNNAHVAALVATLIYILPACQVYRRQRMGQCRDRLDPNTHHYRFSIGYSPLDATGIIAQMVPTVMLIVAQDIVYMRTGSTSGSKARTNFHSFGRWNTHHRHT